MKTTFEILCIALLLKRSVEIMININYNSSSINDGGFSNKDKMDFFLWHSAKLCKIGDNNNLKIFIIYGGKLSGIKRVLLEQDN